MPDKFSKEIRRKTMQAVKSKDTELENTVMKNLWNRGIRFRRNVRDLLGTPDIAIKKHRLVVFVDSCFWHGCKIHFRVPETNREYWQKKIERNKARDLKTTEYYVNHDWHILRIWEHELKQDFEGTIERIVDFVNQFRK
jgi:DNA mismatch endonuclease (patch repair protein)